MVPPAPFSPVCGLGVPPVPLSIGSALKLLPCDHDQGCCSAGMDAGRDAGSRLQTCSTERRKMHLGTWVVEPREAERRGHLKGCA